MKFIDRHSVKLALERSLVPKNTLLDGRSEKDRLGFLADFASVINFYNSKNEIQGNWEPFLLKDPVFLLASISKTNFEDYYLVFQKIRNISDIKKGNFDNVNLDAVTSNTMPFPVIDQLFFQVIDVFLVIEKWTLYMQKTETAYNLKKYLLQEVKQKYSREYWAIIKLQKLLRKKGMLAATSKKLHNSDRVVSNPVWDKSNSHFPYWNVLNLKEDFDKNKPSDFYNAVVRVGDKLFAFFKKNIDYSSIEFNNESIHEDKFPDTLLLRAFTRLMMIHQEQLNNIANKHLDFYYLNILKQEKQKAKPDHVFIVAETSIKDRTVSLPKGTLFAAGANQKKEVVNFKSTNYVELNPANILNSYTLLRTENDKGFSTLQLETIEAPGKMKKDEDGITKHWCSFGSNPKNEEKNLTLGFAISSPLLYLTEGRRTITVKFTFSVLESINIFEGCTFFLSTQEEWLDVTDVVKIKRHRLNDGKAKTLTISLDESVPSIEKFKEDAGLTESEWPMLKIKFSKFINISKPPALSGIDIEVAVSGIQKLELYNDFGGLSPKAPFQIFGSIASKGSNFFIGSNEIFSKPLEELKLNIEWDALPDNFSTYYKAYNEYIEENIGDVSSIDSNEDDSEVDGIDMIDESEVTGETGENEISSEDESDSENKDTSLIDKIEDKIDDVSKGFLSKFGIGKKFLEIVKPIKAFLTKSSIGNFFLKKFNLKSVSSLTSIIPKIVTPRLTLILDLIKNLFQKKKADSASEKDEKPKTDGDIPKGLFSNENFKIDFDVLFNSNWTPLNFENRSTPSIELMDSTLDSKVEESKISPISLFRTNKEKNKISDTSTFRFLALEESSHFAKPSLQGEQLVFSKESQSGFLRMTLEKPKYGFGSQLYSEVVSDVALKNAVIVSQKLKKDDPKLKDLKPAPQPPFITKVKKISADYKASYTYSLIEKSIEYPIECFYFTPFKTYKILDDILGLSGYEDRMNCSLGGTSEKIEKVPIVPSFQYKGGMFIELENLIHPGKLNLYFELSQNSNQYEEHGIEYSYLTDMGWKPLAIIADSTNGFSCSGITTVKIPSDITKNSWLMPIGKYWIFIGTKDNPDSFPKTVLMSINGVKLSRVEALTLNGSSKPYLNKETIKSSVKKINGIGKITQPFSSFGGKQAETNGEMHKRISLRLKTKDRLVSHEDLYSIVLERFPSIYSVKSHYDKTLNQIKVHAVPKVNSWQNANAFSPLISSCAALEIKEELSGLSSSLTQIVVSNFNLIPITVSADIDIEDGFGETEIQQKVIHMLNIYLSPWIKSDIEQTPIGSVLTVTKILSFIQGIEGVENVKDVELSYENKKSKSIVEFNNPSKLIVSSLKHMIS